MAVLVISVIFYVSSAFCQGGLVEMADIVDVSNGLGNVTECAKDTRLQTDLGEGSISIDLLAWRDAHQRLCDTWVLPLLAAPSVLSMWTRFRSSAFDAAFSALGKTVDEAGAHTFWAITLCTPGYFYATASSSAHLVASGLPGSQYLHFLFRCAGGFMLACDIAIVFALLMVRKKRYYFGYACIRGCWELAIVTGSLFLYYFMWPVLPLWVFDIAFYYGLFSAWCAIVTFAASLSLVAVLFSGAAMVSFVGGASLFLSSIISAAREAIARKATRPGLPRRAARIQDAGAGRPSCARSRASTPPPRKMAIPPVAHGNQDHDGVPVFTPRRSRQGVQPPAYLGNA